MRFVRPDFAGDRPPCVVYLHGGGIASQSCFEGNYRVWARLIATAGVAVAMVDFRNAVVPSSAPEVAPYPAGLNDCVSAVRWVAAEADRLGMQAGVPATCRTVMGTVHATEIFPAACPDISRETARSLADFSRGTTGPSAP